MNDSEKNVGEKGRASRRRNSPTSQLFIQKLIQANINKVLQHYWSCVRRLYEFTHNGPVMRKVVPWHDVIISSVSEITHLHRNCRGCIYNLHEDVIKWIHLPRHWPFVWEIHRSPDEFPAQRPVTRSLDIFFDLYLNKRMSKQWCGWWL